MKRKHRISCKVCTAMYVRSQVYRERLQPHRHGDYHMRADVMCIAIRVVQIKNTMQMAMML